MLTPAEEAWAAEQVPSPDDVPVVDQPPALEHAAAAMYEPAQLAASVESELAGADQATVEIDMAALLAPPDGMAGDGGLVGLSGEAQEMPAQDITVRRITQQSSLELEALELEWEDAPRRRDNASHGESARRSASPSSSAPVRSV